jgi:hypothetical protein
MTTDLLQGEKYPTLSGVSRYLTGLLDLLEADNIPADWGLNVDHWSKLEVEPREFHSRVVKELKQTKRWDPFGMLPGLCAMVHPVHFGLEWFPDNRREQVFKQA